MAMVQMLECHEEIFGEIDSSDGEDVELYEQLRVADEKYSFKNRAWKVQAYARKPPQRQIKVS